MTELRPTLTDERLESMIEPIAQELGLVCWDVRVHAGQSRASIQLVMDRAGARGEPGTGVTIEELATMTREVQSLLVLQMGESYDFSLEVSSPGVERDLRKPRDFARQVGDEVRIVRSSPDAEGRVVIEGVLEEADASGCQVRLSNDTHVAVPFDEIRRARTVYHFGAADPSGGGAAKKKGRASAAGAARTSRKP